MLVNESTEYPEHDQEDAARGMFFPDETHENAPPSAPPPQKAVQFCPLPGQVSHLKWWLTTFFVDHLDIFNIYAEMGNDECTEMQFKFQHS